MNSSAPMSFKNFIPNRLRINYNILKNNKFTKSSENFQENITFIENILNDSQPQTPQEIYMRTMIQFMFRKNTEDFYNFIMKNKMNYFIFWTDSRHIVRHFRLQNLVYVKWNGSNRRYKCSEFYRNSNSGNKTARSDNTDTSSDNNPKIYTNNKYSILQRESSVAQKEKECDELNKPKVIDYNTRLQNKNITYAGVFLSNIETKIDNTTTDIETDTTNNPNAANLDSTNLDANVNKVVKSDIAERDAAADTAADTQDTAKRDTATDTHKVAERDTAANTQKTAKRDAATDTHKVAERDAAANTQKTADDISDEDYFQVNRLENVQLDDDDANNANNDDANDTNE
jgi:hypothetical protein